MRWLLPLVFVFLAFVCGCSGARASPARPVTLGDHEGVGISVTELRGATVAVEPRRPIEPLRDHPRERAEREAAEVFRAMHPQILACFAKQRAGPARHAWIVIDVLVGADGRPREVATRGGAPLQSAVLECVSRRVRAAAFAPPAISATSRVSVSFSFHPEGG